MKLRHERGARTAATVAALLLALPAAAAAQSDSSATPTSLAYTTTSGPVPSAGAGTDPGESLTCGGVTMNRTFWWRVTGTGRTVFVDTIGSTADTVAAVYDDGTTPPPASAMLGCQDDVAAGDTTSIVGFPTNRGQTYLVQVGVFNGPPAPAPDGNIQLIAVSPTPNDDRGAAESVPAGSPVARDNIGALTEAGEDLLCEPSGQMDNTVWFRFSAPSAGRAVFSTSGFDTVMQVYRGNEAAPLACNDDSPSSLASRVEMDLQPGDYFIQVGGFGGTQGDFTYQAEFTPAPPPSPPPPAPPAAPPAPPPVTTPGQDRVVRAPRQIAATALLRATPTGSGIRVRSLTVNAGRGARISIRCAPRRACPAQSRTARNVSFRAFRGRRLRAGTRIQIRITRRNAIGRYIEYRITRGNFRRQPDRCIPVGSTRPQRRCR